MPLAGWPEFRLPLAFRGCVEFGCMYISDAVDIPSGGQTSINGMPFEFLAGVSMAVCPLVKKFKTHKYI